MTPPLQTAQPSGWCDDEDTNEGLTPDGLVHGIVPLRFVRKSYAARAVLERAIIERDGSWNCFYCGRVANSVDHVTCRFKGGSDGIDNLVLACWPCNELKNTKPGWFFVLEQFSDLFRGKSALPLKRRVPPLAVDPLHETPHSEHLNEQLTERLEQAVRESAETTQTTKGMART